MEQKKKQAYTRYIYISLHKWDIELEILRKRELEENERNHEKITWMRKTREESQMENIYVYWGG